MREEDRDSGVGCTVERVFSVTQKSPVQILFFR